MSTRSGIALKQEDGTILWTYCHCDGYPAGVGRILNDHYATREQVEKLLALGEMSSLGIMPIDPGDTWRATFTDFRDGESLEDWFSRKDRFDGLYCKAYGAQYPSETVGTYATLRRRFMRSDREWLYLWDDPHGWRVLSKYGECGAQRLTKLGPVVEEDEERVRRYRASKNH